MTAQQAKELAQQNRRLTDLSHAEEEILKAANAGKNKCHIYRSIHKDTIEELIDLGYKVLDVSERNEICIEISFE